MKTILERLAQAKASRSKVPRSSHAGWKPGPSRPCPLDLLEANNGPRVPELIPYRYGRMLASPFTFMRGSPVVMASDLNFTPRSGVRIQICGDAHLGNIGIFASPERSVIIDLNDFDETLPGPWEWDVKRMATSFVVAGRNRGFPDRQNLRAARRFLRSYRLKTAEFVGKRALDAWYEKITVEDALGYFDAIARARFVQAIKKVRRKSSLDLLPRLTQMVDGENHRLNEIPPLIVRWEEPWMQELIHNAMQGYRESLSEERRVLLDRFRVVDFARKVVGVGSVGTRCGVALLMGNHNADPLFLQLKQAMPSVLEPYCGACPHTHQGQRVVAGTRLMQAASDIFLGWTQAVYPDGVERHFFVRQLRDMKGTANLDIIRLEGFLDLANLYGWVLARAHSRSGKAPEIAGYLGTSEAFDAAVTEFARDYADQTERDHQQLAQAVAKGRMEAKT